MKPHFIVSPINIVVILILTCSCSSIRTEFFREETKYQYNFARQLYKQGEYGSAKASIKSVLALDPDYGPAHVALGNIAFIKADYNAALTHYKTAIRVDSELEAALRPVIQATTLRIARAPIEKAGFSMRQVHRLMMAGDQSKIEALLNEDFPLELLAQDTLSITPSELGELSRRVAANLKLDNIWSVRCRLFWAYFLFYNHIELDSAAVLIYSAVPELENKERRIAYEVLGQIHEKVGDLNLAVDAYVLAKKDGLSDLRLSHHLSRIYGSSVPNSENEKQRSSDSSTPTLTIEISVPTKRPMIY